MDAATRRALRRAVDARLRALLDRPLRGVDDATYQLYAADREADRAADVHSRACESCGVAYRPIQRRQRYCGSECRARARRDARLRRRLA